MVAPEVVSEALTNSRGPIKSKLIEKSRNYQYEEYSVFGDLQNGSKQKSVASVVYDLATLMTSQFKN